MNQDKLSNDYDRRCGDGGSASGCPLIRGQLVRSLAGRDKDRYYLVLEVSKDGFVWVADGKTRKAAYPKRKNPKHLQCTLKVAADLKGTSLVGEIKDELIRETINSYISGNE